MNIYTHTHTNTNRSNVCYDSYGTNRSNDTTDPQQNGANMI